MKVAFAIGAIVATFVAPSMTQDITSIPQCAQQPILEAISASDCPLTDIACICANEGFVNGLVQLIPTVCTPDEVELVIEFAETLCSAYDVDINLPTSSSPSGTSSIPPTASQSSSAPASTATSNSITESLTSVDSAVATASATPNSSITSSNLPESAENAASTTPTSSISTGATDTGTSASESSGPAQQTDNAAAASTIVSPAFLGAMAMGIFAVI